MNVLLTRRLVVSVAYSASASWNCALEDYIIHLAKKTLLPSEHDAPVPTILHL